MNAANRFRPHRVLLEAAVGVAPRPQPAALPPQDVRALVPRARRRPRRRRPREGRALLLVLRQLQRAAGRTRRGGRAGAQRLRGRLPGAGLLRHAVPGRGRHRERHRERAAQPGGAGPAVAAGADVVVPQPDLLVRAEERVPAARPGPGGGRGGGGDARRLRVPGAAQGEGTLDTNFTGRAPGKVAYQVPCHLRAQNMGTKTRDVLQLVPGTSVSVIERCTAMDGTWAMKKEFYPISLQYARKAAAEMEAAEPDVFATDCTLSALQIEAVRGPEAGAPAGPAARGLRPRRRALSRCARSRSATSGTSRQYERVREAERARDDRAEAPAPDRARRAPDAALREPRHGALPDPGDDARRAHRAARAHPGRDRRLQRAGPGRGPAGGDALHRDRRTSRP